MTDIFQQLRHLMNGRVPRKNKQPDDDDDDNDGYDGRRRGRQPAVELTEEQLIEKQKRSAEAAAINAVNSYHQRCKHHRQDELVRYFVVVGCLIGIVLALILMSWVSMQTVGHVKDAPPPQDHFLGGSSTVALSKAVASS